MVLSRGQRDDGATIGDGQHTGLLSIQSFFEDDLVSRVTEFAVDDDPLDGLQNLFAFRTHDHTLAGCQPVGFDDQRHILVFFRVAIGDEPDGALGIAKDVIVGRRHIRIAQQVLAEHLAAFQLSGSLGGAEHAQLFRLHRVDDAGDQRRFRTDHGEGDRCSVWRT